MTAGQVSDYIDAAAVLDELLKAQWLLADRFRDALQEKGHQVLRSRPQISHETNQI